MTAPGMPAWGCPWHGPINNGVLALPGGKSMPWPAPSPDNYGSGNTLLQRMPWAVEPEIGEEQALFDVEHGRQWKADALLVGRRMQLHGKNLDGWIYAAPNGTAWRVASAALNSSMTTPESLAAYMQFQLFGRFDAPAVEYGVSISISTGQDSPELTLDEPAYIELMDITPDGSRAIWAIYTPGNLPLEFFGASMPLSTLTLGFLLLEITGTPGDDLDVSVSVLYTRAETLGVGADTGNPLDGASLNAHYRRRGYSDTDTSVVADSTYPVCAGYVTTTTTTRDYSSQPGTRPEVEYQNHYVGTHERRSSVTDRVMAVWFDAAGEPVPVLATVEAVTRIEWGPIVDETTGAFISRRALSPGPGDCELGPPEQVETAHVRFVRRRDVLDTSTVTLQWGEHEIALSGSYLNRRDSVYDNEASGGAYQMTSTVVAESPFGSYSTESTGSLIPPESVFNEGAQGIGGVIAHLNRSHPTTDQDRYRMRPAVRNVALTNNWWLGLFRYSNNLIGCYAGYLDAVEPAASAFYTPALSPAGVVGEQSSTYTGNAEVRLRQYGSFNPATGEVTLNKTAPTAFT